MGKEISRIRLNRLYSESNIFEEISFHDGVNIILGEKYDDSSVKGRKTNGVGKSMSIEFLDFGFLNDYEKSRIAKIPKEVFPLEENVILDLDIGDEAITIKRNRKQADQPVIIREGRTVSFDKLQDAREYLTGLFLHLIFWHSFLHPAIYPIPHLSLQILFSNVFISLSCSPEYSFLSIYILGDVLHCFRQFRVRNSNRPSDEIPSFLIPSSRLRF